MPRCRIDRRCRSLIAFARCAAYAIPFFPCCRHCLPVGQRQQRPCWRQSASAALQASVADQGAMALYGNVEGRFRDNDELRYSLRALERYFPSTGMCMW